MSKSAVLILQVDDNETNRYVISRILTNAGFTVIEATTGESGLRQANEQRPDLIILDVQLPDINGFEVCQRIKSNPETASIPILHLSASFIKSRDRVQGLDSGADAYLAQPVEPIELIATIRALLRIRQAEESALTLAQEWQTTFDSISDGVCLLDRQGRFLRCNLASGELLNQSIAQMLGGSYQSVLPVANEELFAHTQISRQRESQEVQFGGHWFLITIDPIFNQQSDFTGAVYILADITARKQAEAERALLLEREQAARSQAEAANRLKDEFLATLSHELRSPLNAIIGWTQLLTSRQFDTATTTRALDTIGRNARAQAQLVEDLLDVSRIIQGKVRLNVQPLDIKPLIEAAIETVHPAAVAKEIHLQPMLDSVAGKIAGDGDRLQQIVWNLLSNAIKFTPKGGRVQIQLEQLNSQLGIIISDTGRGIEPEFVPYVFDRFRQADSTTTRSYGGLGLGLAIVRHLVELHGGTVHAHSPGIDQGSTFTVKLPMMPIQVEYEENDRVLSKVGKGAPFNPPDLSHVRILVVDDEVDARDYVVAVLQECNAEVQVANSVQEAIARIAQQPPDILISDIGMPEADGYSLIRRVRELPANQGGLIPAVALTAYARVEDRSRAIAAGFQSHLSKPVEPAELVALVVSLARRPLER